MKPGFCKFKVTTWIKNTDQPSQFGNFSQMNSPYQQGGGNL
jgi:hypothetical protein